MLLGIGAPLAALKRMTERSKPLKNRKMVPTAVAMGERKSACSSRLSMAMNRISVLLARLGGRGRGLGRCGFGRFPGRVCFSGVQPQRFAGLGRARQLPFFLGGFQREVAEDFVE